MGTRLFLWVLAGGALISLGQASLRGHNGHGPKPLPKPKAPVAFKVTLVEVGTWDNAISGVKRPGPKNTKKFKATVTPDTKAKIKFVLSAVSKEKGENMNTGDSTGFDLSFENQDGFANPDGDKQEITEDNMKDGTATVIVTANDYGAFGKISAVVVEAIQEDNTPLPSATSIPVLTDADDNNIEDAWDTANPGPGENNSANRDNEEVPEVDGTKGDWLSRYEEYRGFNINGSYESTLILRKEWFYIDVDGIGLTGDMTGAINGNLVVNKLKAGETNATYEVNPNRGHQNVHRQKATPITNSDQTGGVWGLTSTTGGRLPDNVNFCRVWVDRFKRKIASSQDVTNAQRYIPAKANANGGDENISWQTGGRISLEDEHIDYADFQVFEGKTKLFAPATAATTVLLIEPLSGSLGVGRNFFVINDVEQVLVNSSFLIAKVGSSKLNGAVNNAVTVLTVADASQFNYGNLTNAYIVIDDEQMKLSSVNTTKNELTVIRGQNGTTAAAHADNAVVSLPPTLTGVTRAQYGTAAAAHAAGVDTIAPRAFYGCTRGVNGTAAAAHTANTSIPYFFSEEQTNRTITSTFCHEACHTIGCVDMPRETKAIMNGVISPGARDDVGVYHTHHANSIKQMRVRTP